MSVEQFQTAVTEFTHKPRGECGTIRIQFIGVFVEEEFFRPVKQGIKDAGRDLRADVSFTGDAGGDTLVVNRLIFDAVDGGVDGLAVNIIHPSANNEAIRHAMSKGIPVVAFNCDATNGTGPHLAHTQQNFMAAGMKLAKTLLDDVSRKATVLLTKHDANVSALDDRANGIREGLAPRGPSFAELITTQEAHVAAEKIEAALRENPAIEAIFCTGQADTEGAGLAVKKMGGKTLIGGFDLSPTILELVKDGHIRCTIDQQPYMQGYYPVVQLCLNIRYGVLPANMDAGATLIDKSNAEKVMELSQQGYR